MSKWHEKPAVVEAITFDELVEHGRTQVPPHALHNGIPWHFTYAGHVVTHENDDCYLIPTPGGTMRFERGDMLVNRVGGSLHPWKHEAFFAFYERAEDSGAVGFGRSPLSEDAAWELINEHAKALESLANDGPTRPKRERLRRAEDALAAALIPAGRDVDPETAAVLRAAYSLCTAVEQVTVPGSDDYRVHKRAWERLAEALTDWECEHGDIYGPHGWNLPAKDEDADAPTTESAVEPTLPATVSEAP